MIEGGLDYHFVLAYTAVSQPLRANGERKVRSPVENFRRRNPKKRNCRKILGYWIESLGRDD